MGCEHGVLEYWSIGEKHISPSFPFVLFRPERLIDHERDWDGERRYQDKMRGLRQTQLA